MFQSANAGKVLPAELNPRRAPTKKENRIMIKLSWWEEFIVGATISFLTVLQSKLSNPTELAGLQAAIGFLAKFDGWNSFS